VVFGVAGTDLDAPVLRAAVAEALSRHTACARETSLDALA